MNGVGLIEHNKSEYKLILTHKQKEDAQRKWRRRQEVKRYLETHCCKERDKKIEEDEKLVGEKGQLMSWQGVEVGQSEETKTVMISGSNSFTHMRNGNR